VRVLHLLLYAIAGKRDPDLLAAVLRFAPSATVAPLIILAAGFLDRPRQARHGRRDARGPPRGSRACIRLDMGGFAQDRSPAPGMMRPVTDISEQALERAVAALRPFVRRWGLALNPRDVRLMAGVVLEFGQSGEAADRIPQRVEAILDEERDREADEVAQPRQRGAMTREAEERFRAVIESAPVAIVEIGVDDRVNLWNPAAERIFGWPAEEVLGRPPAWVPEDRWGEFRALSDQEARGSGYTGFETVRVRRDGTPLDVEISAAPIRDAAGEIVGAMAILSDISDRKRQQEEIRASRARIVQAADDARRKLERNLHDGAQQRLVALSVSLRLAEAKLAGADTDSASAILAEAREELGRALEELRDLARGIHPALLTERGLAAALRAMVARVSLPVELDLAEERLPPPVEAALYYVAAEALTNIVKYAGASSAGVHLQVRDDGVVVAEVSDDGVGGADPSRGSGLRGLVDRVEALDGRLLVDSPSGGGTRVRVEVPVSSKAPG
jgi:PAS domain S-box-containing protein